LSWEAWEGKICEIYAFPSSKDNEWDIHVTGTKSNPLDCLLARRFQLAYCHNTWSVEFLQDITMNESILSTRNRSSFMTNVSRLGWVETNQWRVLVVGTHFGDLLFYFTEINAKLVSKDPDVRLMEVHKKDTITDFKTVKTDENWARLASCGRDGHLCILDLQRNEETGRFTVEICSRRRLTRGWLESVRN
jgi:hypothetical protein